MEATPVVYPDSCNSMEFRIQKHVVPCESAGLGLAQTGKDSCDSVRCGFRGYRVREQVAHVVDFETREETNS
jgi:hypothetical protein